MKNRKIFIALLLVASLALGIGYAGLTDMLKINGTAGVSQGDGEAAFEEDVYFSKAIAGAGATASVGADNDTAVLTVNPGALKTVGDEVIATYTIKSDSDLSVKITNPTAGNALITNSNTEYFQVFTNWVADHTLTPDSTGSATVDITVTVKLIKTPTADQSVTFGIQLNAESQP